jgi:hypothetical protein
VKRVCGFSPRSLPSYSNFDRVSGLKHFLCRKSVEGSKHIKQLASGRRRSVYHVHSGSGKLFYFTSERKANRTNYDQYTSNKTSERKHLATTSTDSTLKALANFSPGLRFGNPEERPFISLRHNSERVVSLFADSKAVATPSELRRTACGSPEPRVSKQTLGWSWPTLSAYIPRYDLESSRNCS